MRKIILIAISFLLLACSTLSLKDLQVAADTPSAPPTPNTTLVALYVQATVLAAQNDSHVAQTPAPAQECVQLPTSCPAPEVNSPIFPSPPTVSVPSDGVGGEPVGKSVSAASATPIPSPTATAVALKPYQIQANSPVYLSNFAHQTQACKWAGVAGQVFDLSGAPAKNIVLVVSGKLNGANIYALGMTGTTHLYGSGGYEIVLGSTPVASTATLAMTVYGLDGVALSDSIPFNTVGDCQKNLTLINFKQVR